MPITVLTCRVCIPGWPGCFIGGPVVLMVGVFRFDCEFGRTRVSFGFVLGFCELLLCVWNEVYVPWANG